MSGFACAAWLRLIRIDLLRRIHNVGFLVGQLSYGASITTDWLVLGLKAPVVLIKYPGNAVI